MAEGPDIQVILAAQFADLQKGMQDAAQAVVGSIAHMENAMKEGQKRTEESARSITETIKHLAEAFGVFKALEWGKEVITGSMELAERLGNLSISTGISTDKLQTLDFAAQLTGGSLDRLAMVVGRLSRATLTKTGLGALSFFGISASETNDAFAALEKVGDKIKELGTNSAAVRGELLQLFGRAGLTMIPMIEEIGEADEKMKAWGLTISGQTLGQVKAAQESFNELGFVWQQDKLILTAELAPAIEAIAKILTEYLATVGGAANNTQTLHDKGVALANQVINLAEAISDTLLPTLETLWHVLDAIVLPFHLVGEAISAVIHPVQSLEALVPGGVWGDTAAQLNQSADAATRLHNAFEKIRSEVAQTKEAGVKGGASDIPIPPAAGSDAAARKAKKDKLEQFTEELRLEEAEHSKDVNLKVANEQKIYDFTVRLYGARSVEARKAALDVQKAENEAATQRQKIALDALANDSKIAEARVAVAQDAIKRQTALQERQIKDSFSLKKGGQQQEAEQELSINQIEAQAQRDAENQEYNEKRSNLEKQLQILKTSNVASLTEIQNLNTEIETLDIAHGRKMQDIDFQSAQKRLDIEQNLQKQIKQNWQTTETSIEQSVQSMTDQFLTNTNRIGQEWTKMTQKMALDLINALLFGTGQNSLLGRLLGPMFQQGQGGGGGLLGMLLGGSGLQQQVQQAFTSNQGIIQTVFGNAFQGLTGVLHSVFSAAMSGISAVAGGFGGIGSLFGFSGGGIVPSAAGGMVTGSSGTMAILHPHEMVLPRAISEHVMNSMGNGSTGQGHVFAPNINIHAIDSADFKSHLEEHADAIHGILRDGARQMGLLQ